MHWCAHAWAHFAPFLGCMGAPRPIKGPEARSPLLDARGRFCQTDGGRELRTIERKLAVCLSKGNSGLARFFPATALAKYWTGFAVSFFQILRPHSDADAGLGSYFFPIVYIVGGNRTQLLF